VTRDWQLPVNVFARLHKWALRQDENFMTECLAVVVQMLLDMEAEAGLRLVRLLSASLIAPPPEDASLVEVRTQIGTSEGRPDLEIRTPNCLSVIEVKVEAEVQRGQLEGYREYLRCAPFPRKNLVLLCKRPPRTYEGGEPPDAVVWWHEVADVIEQLLLNPKPLDPACRFLVAQLFDFLRERNMAIAQVTWEMPQGARALRSFMDMLLEAARHCGVSATKAATLDYMGWKLDAGRFWVGLLLGNPEKVWLSTEVAIDVEAARKLEGLVEVSSYVDGGYQWWYGADLESEESHFFSRSKVGQIQWLQSFLEVALKLGRQIVVGEAPPIPNDAVEG
jgi:hypothetical protein